MEQYPIGNSISASLFSKKIRACGAPVDEFRIVHPIGRAIGNGKTARVIASQSIAFFDACRASQTHKKQHNTCLNSKIFPPAARQALKQSIERV